jgi:hypothetical protein
MSTQFDTSHQQAPYQQAPYQQAPYQQAPNQRSGGPSWLGIWAAVIGTAIAAVLIVLAFGLSHSPSTTTPPSPGSSTSVPAHPSTPVVPPAHPTAPSGN